MEDDDDSEEEKKKKVNGPVLVVKRARAWLLYPLLPGEQTFRRGDTNPRNDQYTSDLHATVKLVAPQA